MNFFSLSIPIGRYFGIHVRIHILFLLYVLHEISSSASLQFTIVFLTVLWISILLHEFGHALVARWCDGHADEIILWPLGGLAMCRPVFNATAHLLTSIGGPFVSLVLFATSFTLLKWFPNFIDQVPYIYEVCSLVYQVNSMLLLFNLIPAFPMDGGRIVRDLLWYKFGVVRATSIAVGVTRIIAIASVPLIFFTESYWFSQNYTLLVLAFFIYTSAEAERDMLHWEGPVQSFSILERIRRGRRKKQFDSQVMQIIQENQLTAFHRCASCGKTELHSKDLVFRVAQDGHEYCFEHLPKKGSAPLASPNLS